MRRRGGSTTPTGGGGADGSGPIVSPIDAGHGHGTIAGRSRAGVGLGVGVCAATTAGAAAAWATVARTNGHALRATTVTAAAVFLKVKPGARGGERRQRRYTVSNPALRKSPIAPTCPRGERAAETAPGAPAPYPSVAGLPPATSRPRARRARTSRPLPPSRVDESLATRGFRRSLRRADPHTAPFALIHRARARLGIRAE